MQILKYTISATKPEQLIDMPISTKILSIQVQQGQACIWALVNTHLPTVTRVIHVITTGEEFAFDYFTHQYVGTFQLEDGNYVAHVFIERIARKI